MGRLGTTHEDSLGSCPPEGPVQSAIAAFSRSLYTVRVMVTAGLGPVLGSPRCGAQATKSRW